MAKAEPGARLQRLRQLLGLSQRQMATELGVTPGALAMWERKTRPVPAPILKIIEIYEEALDEELARRKHQAMIRKLSTTWANRLLVMFGKGAYGVKRAEIKSRLQRALNVIFTHELSIDRIKRSIQLAIFNRIVNAASQTKGLPMKVVQILTYLNPGMSREAREAVEEIHCLQYPLAPTVVSRIITESLGASPNRIFAEWSPHPFAAASIGQVHLAKLKTGERVAVKVQYPDIQKSLSRDLKALQFVMDISRLFSTDVRGVIEDVKRTVLDETDYYKEMESLESFARLFKDDPQIITPKVYREYSHANIITMDFIDGKSIKEFKSADYEERRMAAETLARFTTLSSFKSGLVNTDAHAGNFIFCGGGKVGFIDFGRSAPGDLNGSYAFKELMKAVILKNPDLAKKVIDHFPFIRDPKTFPFEQFWEFFVRQQAHLNSGKFRFTHDYIARTFAEMKACPFRDELKVTIETVWSTAVMAGIWRILADLDVEVDYGRVSLEALGEQ